jgi:hypothetical protein
MRKYLGQYICIIKLGDVPDTDLAGYQVNQKAGYGIPGKSNLLSGLITDMKK